ncbi:MAG: SulP family inorganic anion transporter, partial [Acetobacteraceae bacterium]
MQPVSPQPPLQARVTSVQHDLIAGVTLAAYAIPVSLAYATLAGLPPQVGLYGYMAGGLGYALAGSSRYLAVGPTSAISLMIGGTVGSIAGDNPGATYQIVVNTAVVAGLICLLAWLFRLSVLVKLISDSVLTGFKAGAGLTIALTQMPALLGVPGGGHSTPERILLLLQQLNQTNVPTLAFGLAVLALLIAGDRFLPGKPISLAVVALSIAVASMLGVSRFGVAVTGVIPPGLPSFVWPDLRLHNYEGIVPLAAGCVLLAYIEGVAAARAFALKHGQEINPRREFLGLGAANLATGLIGGYPVAGGLSQTAVNESAGARSRLSLMFASVTLAF